METGSQHRGNVRRVRTHRGRVWRAVAAAAAGFALIAASLVAAPSPPAQAQDGNDQALIDLVNEWRASRGLNRLAASSSLSTKALDWSTFMAGGSAACTSAGSRFAHSVLSLADPANPPGTRAMSENLAYNCGPPGVLADASWSTALGPLPSYCTTRMDFTTPEITICGWLTSASHRAAIETPTFTHIGSGTASVSVANGTVERFVTHLFTESTLPAHDVSCDGSLDITDALLIAQFSVGTRTDAGSCAIRDTRTELNAGSGDLDRNGRTDIVDALLVARCVVGIDVC